MESKDERFSTYITVGLLLIKDNKILLMRRCNTGYEDGKYALVAGHIESNESLKQAMIRETKEEVGIKLNEKDLHIICSVRNGKNDKYINFFLKADSFQGFPTIMEKDKCDDLRWFDLDNLPNNIITSDERAINNYKKGIAFDEYDFM